MSWFESMSRGLLRGRWPWLVLVAMAALVDGMGAVPVTALSFTPDGRFLVSNGDRRLEVRSPVDASTLRSLPCDMAKITSIAFEPKGRFLAVAGGEPGRSGEVRLFSWPEGRLLQQLGGYSDLVACVSFDTEGARLAVAAWDQTAGVWQRSHAGNYTNMLPLKGHAGPVTSIAFAPSGKSVLTASADRSLKVWASVDGRLVRTLSHHTEAIHALAVIPSSPKNGSTLAACASSGDDRSVRIWQPEIGRMVRIVRQHEGSILALASHPDGSSLCSAGSEGIIRMIDASSDSILSSWRAHDDWIYVLALNGDGSKLASGSGSGKVRIDDLRAAPQP